MLSRIRLGNITDLGEKIIGEILIDGIYAGYYEDFPMSGEMYFHFEEEESEEIFYSLTKNYRGIKENPEIAFIDDLRAGKI